MAPARKIPALFVTGALATLVGCGGAPSSSPEPAGTPRGVGSIHAVVQSAHGPMRPLQVEYAAAGLSGSLESGGGSLVIVGVFRDGRVDDSLDLQTLSISVPLAELFPAQSGVLDVVVDGAELNLLLEGSADSDTRVLSPESVRGMIHLRYDAPPRPGITVRGDFSLVVETENRTTLRLDGELDVPVLGG